MKGKNLLIVFLLVLTCILSFIVIRNEITIKGDLELIRSKEKESDELETDKHDKLDKDRYDEESKVDSLNEEEMELSDFLNDDDGLETPTREYGTEEFIITNSGKILTYIVYPKGEISDLNVACENWVNQILSKYESEEGTSDGNLLISYNSYKIANKYVVVEFNGEFISSNYAHPDTFFASFNADVNTGKVLTIQDILEENEISSLKDYLIKEHQIDKNFIDDEFLDDWMIRDNGVEIVIEKGKYLAESEGLIRDLVTYKILDAISDKKIDDEIVEKQADKIVESAIVADEKLIALTFDDGPGAYTARLLDILKENNVKATFFVLGSQIDSKPDLLSRMMEDGHEIGGHSWTHRSFTTLSDEELTKEIMQTRAKIESITGCDPLSVRPPYGAYNDHVKDIAKELGVHFVNWNVDPLDWKTKDANLTYRTIVDTASHGNIVLSHDIHVSTVDAMERIIPSLLSQGYRFVTVSELLVHGGRDINPGEVYFSMIK